MFNSFYGSAELHLISLKLVRLLIDAGPDTTLALRIVNGPGGVRC